MIKTRIEVPIHEVDGREVGVSTASIKLKIESHWNRSDLVVITVPEKMIVDHNITVRAKDIKAAIENATNTARW